MSAKEDSRGPPNASKHYSKRVPFGLRRVKTVSWILLYLALASMPLLLLLLGPVPKGGGLWWDFAMGLGFAGLAMMGLQFVLTARFRKLTAPFGIDIIYYFHRWAAVAAFALIFAHYMILRVRFPDTLGPANPFSAPAHMTAGRAALALFLVLIISSLWRKQFKIEYDWWRITHGILASCGVALAIWHILGVGYYTKIFAKGFVWIAFSVIWLLVLVYIRLVRPWRLLQKPWDVVSVAPERADSWTVTVKPRTDETLSFSPGQFAWLTLGTSPFRCKEHPFSISSSADQSDQLQFTIKELGDFTRTIKNIPVGTRAYVDAPYGIFTTDLFPDAPGFIMIAGGVGIAPIISMLRTLAGRNDDRSIQLLYGNSSWDRILFREEIENLKSNLNLEVVHVLHDPPAGWTGPVGNLSAEVLGNSLRAVPPGFVYFVCGPKGMIQSAQRTLRKLGVPLRHIHYEHFDMA